MLFHFQYRSCDRWEAIGSGEGGGIEAPMAALTELNGLSGGTLPVGSYRCIAARVGSAYWEHLVIGADRVIGFAEDELVEHEAGTPAEWISPSVRSPHPV